MVITIYGYSCSFLTINSGTTITHGHLQFIKYINCGKTMPRTTTNFTSHGWIIVGLPPIITIFQGGTYYHDYYHKC
jgi:hypothetical protein